jgi:hypothetical protein
MFGDFDPSRELAEMPLEYPHVYVMLVDALREYIRTDEAIERDLLNDGSITMEDVAKHKPHMDACRALLRDLEAYEIDPSLHYGVR